MASNVELVLIDDSNQFQYTNMQGREMRVFWVCRVSKMCVTIAYLQGTVWVAYPCWQSRVLAVPQQEPLGKESPATPRTDSNVGRRCRFSESRAV